MSDMSRKNKQDGTESLYGWCAIDSVVRELSPAGGRVVGRSFRVVLLPVLHVSCVVVLSPPLLRWVALPPPLG